MDFNGLINVENVEIHLKNTKTSESNPEILLGENVRKLVLRSERSKSSPFNLTNDQLEDLCLSGFDLSLKPTKCFLNLSKIQLKQCYVENFSFDLFPNLKLLDLDYVGGKIKGSSKSLIELKISNCVNKFNFWLPKNYRQRLDLSLLEEFDILQFPQLKILSLSNIYNLRELKICNHSCIDVINLTECYHLTSLNVNYCQNLKSITISQCNQIEINGGFCGLVNCTKFDMTYSGIKKIWGNSFNFLGSLQEEVHVYLPHQLEAISCDLFSSPQKNGTVYIYNISNLFSLSFDSLNFFTDFFSNRRVIFRITNK